MRCDITLGYHIKQMRMTIYVNNTRVRSWIVKILGGGVGIQLIVVMISLLSPSNYLLFILQFVQKITVAVVN